MNQLPIRDLTDSQLRAIEIRSPIRAGGQMILGGGTLLSSCTTKYAFTKMKKR